jgi:hypothetical protein
MEKWIELKKTRANWGVREKPSPFPRITII